MADIITTGQLAEIVWSIYEFIDNPGNPLVIDKSALVWLMFMEKIRKDQAPVSTNNNSSGHAVIQYRNNGGLSTQYWSGRQKLLFAESEIDFDLAYDFTQNHVGMEIVHQQLKNAGFHIVPNAARGEGFASPVSKSAKIRIQNLLTEKIKDMKDQFDIDRDHDWLVDGSADPMDPAGLDALLPLDPTSGTVGGRSRANPLLQHHVILNSSTGAGGSLRTDLNQMVRQAMTRTRMFNGKIDFLMAGSLWIDGYIAFATANQLRTNAPASGIGKIDIGIPDTDVFFDGIPVIFNPTMDFIADELGDSTWKRRCYGINSKTFQVGVPEGEWKEETSPLDPADERVTRFSNDGRISLQLTNPNGNFVSTVAV